MNYKKLLDGLIPLLEIRHYHNNPKRKHTQITFILIPPRAKRFENAEDTVSLVGFGVETVGGPMIFFVGALVFLEQLGLVDGFEVMLGDWEGWLVREGELEITDGFIDGFTDGYTDGINDGFTDGFIECDGEVEGSPVGSVEKDGEAVSLPTEGLADIDGITEGLSVGDKGKEGLVEGMADGSVVGLLDGVEEGGKVGNFDGVSLGKELGVSLGL